MQNALLRLRELEEQVKTIPQLEVKISILTRERTQLYESVGVEKERVREAERENSKLKNQLKNMQILQDDNEKLMFHIQELETIVDKVTNIQWTRIRKKYTGGAYKKHFLTQIFGIVSYRGPHRFFPKNGLYIGVIFKVAKI